MKIKFQNKQKAKRNRALKILILQTGSHKFTSCSIISNDGEGGGGYSLTKNKNKNWI